MTVYDTQQQKCDYQETQFLWRPEDLSGPVGVKHPLVDGGSKSHEA